MWKDRRPTGHKATEETRAEVEIEQRDKSIRELLDELVSGTQELKSLYTGDKSDRRANPFRPPHG